MSDPHTTGPIRPKRRTTFDAMVNGTIWSGLGTDVQFGLRFFILFILAVVLFILFITRS